MPAERARQRRHRPFEQIERAVEQRVVAAVLDHGAGVSNRRAIATEELAGVGERKPAGDVGEIHGDLARQCDLRLAPAQAVQLVVGDAEDLYDRLLDRLARRSKGASATAGAMRAER